MAAQTNDGFIREKLVNFVNFLTKCLEKRMHHTRFQEFAKKLDELRNVDTGHFVLYITEKMVPHKENPGVYILRLLTENDIQMTDLKNDELEKLTRYVSCFIEVVS